MEDNNNPVQENSVNETKPQAAPAAPVTPQPAAFAQASQPAAPNPAVIYQQPGVQQGYYARPVTPVPYGYGVYARPVQQVQPMQPVQAMIPVQQVPQYQARPVAAPVNQAAPQPAAQAAKTAGNDQTSSKGSSDSGNGGKRSVVMPVIFSIALALLLVYSVVQTLYVVNLNKKLNDITVPAKETTVETEPEESNPEESEPSESEEPKESGENEKPGFSIDKADPNRKVLTTTQIVAEASPATIPVYIMKGKGDSAKKAASGTGFIITKDGYIVTNAHVVQYVTESPTKYFVTVLLPDDTKPVEAEIVGSDTQTDIAVLKVKSDKELPCLKFGDSDKLQSGETVIAIGNALGQLDDTVTVGVVSATNRDISNSGYTMKVIQTDAAINNGNSGGPLINSYGEVIGITNAKIATSTSEGLGFAIPVNSVKSVIESLINNGKVINRPFFGFSVKYCAEGEYEEGSEAGVYIYEVVKGSPASKAGIKVGDRLISLDGVEIKTTNDIILVRDSHKVGDKIECVVDRDGESRTLSLEIGDSGDYQESGSSGSSKKKADEDDDDYED